VIAEKIFYPRKDGPHWRADHVAEPGEDLMGLGDEAQAFGGVPALARDVAEQAERMPRFSDRPRRSKRSRASCAHCGFFGPVRCAQHFRAPAFLEREAPAREPSLNSSRPRASGAGSFRASRSSQEIEEHFRRRVVLAG